ncbi:MAG TPA: PAS domain S-box protein, partial [Burkholderiales bacterium]|nr:PAS domain S-box protein [Burkholderiales bacterium]
MQVAAATNRDVKGAELKVTTPSGSSITLLGNATPLRDEAGHIIGSIAAFQDISAIKAYGAALQDSHKSMLLFIEHAPAAVAMFDRDMRYMAVSRRWMDNYRLGQQDVVGKSHYEVFPEITQQWKAIHLRGLSGEIVAAQNDRFDRQDGTVQWLNWEVRPWYRANEEIGGIVIFTEDVTEHKIAESKLVASEASYRALFENMNAGFVLFEAVLDGQDVVDLTILAANRNFEATTGMKRPNVIGRRLTEVLPGIERDAADWIGTYGKVALTGEPRQFEQGSELLGVYYSVSAYQAGPNQCAVTFQDITERRNATNQLRLWAESFEKLHLALSMADASTNKFISVNPAFAKERGYTPEELVGKPVFSVFPEDLHEEVQSRIALLDTQTHLVYESEHVTKDGRRFPVLLDITTILSEDGKPLNRIAYALNLTDMFEAQQQLKLWGELFEKADFGLAISDATTNHFISVNPAYAREHGYDRSELEGREIFKIFPDRQIREDILSELGQKSHFVTECEHITKDGRRFPVQMDVTAIHDHDGKPDKCIMYTVDITERKRDEAKLLEQDEVFREMSNLAHVGGWGFDPATGEGAWTDEVARIHDLPPSDSATAAYGLSFYHGDSRVQIEKAVQEAMDSGKPYDLELQIVSAKGHHKWVRTICNPIVENGKVVRVRGAIQDITAHKKAETALIASENRFRTIMDYAPIGMAITSVDGGIMLVNQAFCDMLGYTKNELEQKSFEEITHPEDIGLTLEDRNRLLTQEIDRYQKEKRYLRKDGKIVWAQVTSSIFIGSDKPYFIAQVED